MLYVFSLGGFEPLTMLLSSIRIVQTTNNRTSSVPPLSDHGKRAMSSSRRQAEHREGAEGAEGGEGEGSEGEEGDGRSDGEKLCKALRHLSSSQAPLCPNAYHLLLRASIETNNASSARQVHQHLVRSVCHDFGNLGSAYAFLADYLVVALAKCGAVDDAEKIASSLDHLTVHSCTALISAYAQCGYGSKSLEMYEYMKQNGVEPNTYTFVALFKACAIEQDLETGRFLHSDARRRGFTSNPFIINTLISMYGKCGSVPEAETAFCGSSHPDPMAWSVMLSVYAQQGQGRNALLLYRQMQDEGIKPNRHALTSIVQACSALSEDKGTVFVKEGSVKEKALEILKALHAHPHMKGWHLDVVLGTAVLSAYGKCGAIAEAMHTFDALSHRDPISWNALLSMLVEHGHGEDALCMYRSMQTEGIPSNEVAFVVALQACSLLITRREEPCGKHEQTKSMCLGIGKALHEDAKRKGYASDPDVGTGLISMYSVAGLVDEAEVVFFSLLHRDTVVWNAMLSAYTEQGFGEKTLKLYRQMRAEGVNANEATFVVILQSCSLLSVETPSVVNKGKLGKELYLELVRALHAEARREGFTSNIIVGNSFLNLYGKFGEVGDIENVFAALPFHDIISWTSLLKIYSERDQGEKAISLYKHILEAGMDLDDVVLVSILQACKATGNLNTCKQIHFAMVSAECDQYPSLAVALISTYGSCSSMVDAEAICGGLYNAEIIAWTACITGYAEAGHSFTCLNFFEQLKLARFRPDGVSFTAILAACCHTGLVIEGFQYFLSMYQDYNITPQSYHYGILVDMFGRVGDFHKIENLLRNTSIQSDISVWLCLLGACRSHSNLELAKKAFDRAIHLQPEHGSAYVFLSNIYADGVPDE